MLSAWSALFEARYREGVDRIHLALAGMNAHINRDLALALLATDAALSLVPAADSPEFADYQFGQCAAQLRHASVVVGDVDLAAIDDRRVEFIE